MAQIMSIGNQRWPHISSIKSINRKVWKVVETKIEIGDPENPIAAEEVLLQNNDIALSAIHDTINERTFEQIKNIEMTHEAWKKLEESCRCFGPRGPQPTSKCELRAPNPGWWCKETQGLY